MECSVLKRCQYRKNVQKKTGGVLPSVLWIEYTLSKTVLGKSAVISENQTATSDGERGMLLSDYLVRWRLVFLLCSSFTNPVVLNLMFYLCTIVNVL